MFHYMFCIMGKIFKRPERANMRPKIYGIVVRNARIIVPVILCKNSELSPLAAIRAKEM